MNDSSFDPRLVRPDREGVVVVDDGTTLPVQEFGAGPAVVLANGIGVRWPGLAWQIAALRDRCRVVCWDYRGVGRSRLASPDADVSMGCQAEDALAVLDRLGIDRAVFGGWSMGVQVSLEVLRRRPDRVAGFAALLGAPRLAQAPLDLAVALPDVAFAVLTRVLFVGPDADRRVFDGDVRWVAETDRRAYLRTMLELAEHDAHDVLADIRCPALVVCGSRDHVTPPRVAREMADAIPGAELLELPGATHFGLIEQPEPLNARLRDLVRRAHGG